MRGASVRTMVFAGAAALVASCPAAGRTISTYDGDAARTGVYAANDALSPSLVQSGTFGQVFDTKLPQLNGKDQQVYAQPLLAAPDNGPAHKVLVVVTEQNGVYELDPATGQILRSRRLAPNGEAPFDPTGNHLSSTSNCTDISPSVGITSTPVIDSAADGGNGVIYLTAKFATGGSPDWPGEYRMFALRLGDLSDLPAFTTGGTPGKILSFSADNAPSIAFNPKYELQRPALLWMDGVVYAGFGGHCDVGNYRGWVVGIDAASGAYTARWTTEAGQGAWGAGIWMAGGGLMSDGSGRLFAVTGNALGTGGTPHQPAPGTASPTGLGESAVRLQVGADRALTAKDFFTPFDAQTLDAYDLDFGSGGIAALPDSLGTPAHPHAMIAVGKNGVVYLLDRDHLGGFAQGPGSGDDVIAKLGPVASVWGKPTAWPGAGGWLYVPTVSAFGSTSGALRYFKIGGGHIVDAGGTSEAFAYGSGSPIVTSEADAPDATAIVWVVDKPGSGSAILRAYSPTIAPGADAPALVASFPVGAYTKFGPPGAGDNRVYVANATGDVYGFGHPVTPVLTASPNTEDFGTVPVGSSSAPAAITFTVTSAQASLTYQGVVRTASTPSDFALGSPTYKHGATTAPLTAGRTLVTGDTITVPVTFAPTGSPGQRGGAIRVDTDHGPAGAALTGYAQSVAPWIDHTPASVAFGAVAIGAHATRTATFTNLGAGTLHVTAVSGAPGAGSPFTVDGLPAAGDTIAPDGGMADLTIHYDPTQASPAGGDTLDLVVRSDAANDGPGAPDRAAADELVVTATADTAPRLTVAPLSLDFGTVAPGAAAVRSFMVSNDGGTPAQITRSKPPGGGAFTPLDALPEGTTIQGHSATTLRVRFSPLAAGTFTDGWSINGTGSTGVQDVRFAGAAAARPSAPTAPAGAPLRARIVRVHLRPARFRPARRGRMLGAHGGMAVTLTLDRAATVRVGLRRGRLAASSVVKARHGTTTFHLTGRLHGRALRAGRYELVLTVLDAAGRPASPSVTRRFRVLARG
jgi:Abnormal spindle-like microcephaly-assoc'd, ASPM-SPD-2-Hydin